MGHEDAERARVRSEMRSGWSLANQRTYAERELEAVQRRLRAIAVVAEEVARAEAAKSEA